MTSPLVLAMAVVCAAPAARVYVLSPDPGMSALVVAPMVEVAPLESISSAPVGAVVWVAAECQQLDDATASTLADWARRGGIVVVEDATRLARGPLAEAAAMKVAAPSAGGPSAVRLRHAGHPAALGVPLSRWRLRPPRAGVPVVREPADVIIEADDGRPVLWSVPAGRGKIVCLAVDRLVWRPGDAIGYDALLTQLLLAVSGEPARVVAEAAARGALRAWMYLAFPAGQALYRLRASVPAEYEQARRDALAALAVATSQPAQALRLARSAAEKAAQVAAWAERFWRKVPVDALRKCAQRREILLCPGTLDFVHAMNMSTGPSGPGLGRPSSGRELWPGDLADAASAAATCHWRGLKPVLDLPPELPTGINKALRQVTADGRSLWAPRWLAQTVQQLVSRSVPRLAPGTVVLYCHGQPWAAASCEPAGDYSPQAAERFAALARTAGLETTKPPAEWQPSRRWLLWQQVRAQCGTARWSALASAVHSRSDSAALLADAAYISDPRHGGPCPETGFAAVDGAVPVILANYATGFDPADVVAQVRWIIGALDADGDGQPDRWPGAVARFRWADALTLPPQAYRLVASLALAAGARGIMHTWAQSARYSDAALACPEDVYVRCESSFAPALSLQRYWLEAKPVADVLVWRSWTSAAMARPDDAAEQAAAAAAEAWGALLARAGFLPAFVGDSVVERGQLGHHGCLVAPSVLCASQVARESLEKFVRSGGVLVLGPGSIAFDETHQPLRYPPLLGGVSGGTADSAEAKVVRLTKSRPGSTGGPNLGPLAAATWRPASGADVLLREGNGRAIAWAWSFGRGTIVYLSRQPRPGAALGQWLAKTLARYGVRPAASADAARCIVSRLGDSRYLVAVYNPGPVGQQQAIGPVRVSLRMARVRHVAELVPKAPARYDAVTWRPVATRTVSGATVFTTTLSAHQCRLFIAER